MKGIDLHRRFPTSALFPSSPHHRLTIPRGRKLKTCQSAATHAPPLHGTAPQRLACQGRARYRPQETHTRTRAGSSRSFRGSTLGGRPPERSGHGLHVLLSSELTSGHGDMPGPADLHRPGFAARSDLQRRRPRESAGPGTPFRPRLPTASAQAPTFTQGPSRAALNRGRESS